MLWVCATCACMHACMRVCMCTHSCACVCAHVRACVQACLHVHACVCMRACVHACMCTHAHACVCVHVCVCMHACVLVFHCARARVCVVDPSIEGPCLRERCRDDRAKAGPHVLKPSKETYIGTNIRTTALNPLLSQATYPTEATNQYWGGLSYSTIEIKYLAPWC